MLYLYYLFGLFCNKFIGTIYGLIIGAMLDLIIGTQVGINTVVLGMIGFLASVFDKNFSKDSRVTIMFMVLGSTLIYEISIYILNYFINTINIELLSFIKILAIEVLYNMIITIIIYPLMEKFGYYIENEYKGNKILTRYF